MSDPASRPALRVSTVPPALVQATAGAEPGDLLCRVRSVELEVARALGSTAGSFQPGHTVVELGGGSGYQASLIASWGCRVQSYDIAGRPAAIHTFHPVADYDGVHLPEPAGGADVVFSSNVLEHVTRLSELLGETYRVLRPGGVAIHIVPTPSWRFWTLLAHYPFLVFTLLGVPTGFVDWRDRAARQEQVRKRGLAHLVRRALWAGAHGTSRSAVAELVGFHRRTWVRALEAAGFEIVEVVGTGIYYSGYGLLPGLSMRARHRLARWLGASTQVVVARRSTEGTGKSSGGTASAPTHAQTQSHDG